MEAGLRDIEFLFELGSLRNVPRGWRQHLGMDCASNLEHMIRVAWLAIIIARMEGVKNEEKILKMALIHDAAEARVSDLSYVQKVYVKADEERAAKDMLSNTLLESLYNDVFLEYEKRESAEAKIVKDADNLDIDLELKEFDEMGSKVPQKWSENRRMIRDEKLYTESAKKIWDLIQESDPSTWHMKTNKFKLIPSAGR